MASNGMMYASVLVLILAASVCYGAPSFKLKSEWPMRAEDGEEGRAVLTANCDPVTGRCWDWLPIGDTRLDEYAIEQDAAEFNRGQPIHVRDVDQATADSWQDTAPVYGRVAKKDAFTSHGWAAGGMQFPKAGMPFSALYMGRRAPPGTQASKTHKNSDPVRMNEELSSLQPLPIASAQQQQPHQQQPSYRVSVRNGVHGSQPRRHYSIIPQLFISYGWGPSGK